MCVSICVRIRLHGVLAGDGGADDRAVFVLVEISTGAPPVGSAKDRLVCHCSYCRAWVEPIFSIWTHESISCTCVCVREAMTTLLVTLCCLL